MYAIEVQGLTKSFGKVKAVDGVTFDIPTGRVTGFLGPNGAGKTTTLRMILGLVEPDEGTARVFGGPFAETADPARAVGAVLDTAQFHPGRSARNHLDVIALAAGIDRRRVDEVLKIVELDAAGRRRVGGFSLGMRQRLGLAGALLGDPRLLVLDEPANGLDPAGIRWLRGFLRSFASDGRAVFLSSHLLSEVSEMADDVVVIDRGRLVTHSPVAALLGDATHATIVVTSEPHRLAKLLAARGTTYEHLSADTLRVQADRQIVGRIAAESGVPIFGLQTEERSLEDVFFQLTRETERSR